MNQARKERKHAQTVAFHREQAEKTRIAWGASERERIVFVQRLLRGDAEAVEQSVLGEIEDLDFPFESECSVAVDEEDHVLIDVDLSEIEDVIPETRNNVLKLRQPWPTLRLPDARSGRRRLLSRSMTTTCSR